VSNQFTNLGWGNASDNNFLDVYGAGATCSNAPPTITSNGAGTSATLSQDETQQTVTTVTAIDLDNNTLVYSITGGVDAARFTIDSTTGVLSFRHAPYYYHPMDSDKNNTYDVQVTVSDGQGGTDVQTLTISITTTATSSSCPMPIVGAANNSTFTWPGTPSTVTVSTTNSWSAVATNFNIYNVAGDNRPLSGTKRWDKTGPMQLTLTFNPAIPANEVSLTVVDIGHTVSETYNPHVSLKINNATAGNDFVMRATSSANALLFNASTSQVVKDTLWGTARETGTLVGTTSTLIGTLSLDSSDIRVDDFVAYELAMIGKCDFGDAPDTTGVGPAAGDYNTLYASVAPVHIAPPNANHITAYLGSGVTSEKEAIPNSTATGDTDDGVTIPALRQGRTDTISAVVNGAGYLQAWVDWNYNGLFDTPSEQVAMDLQDNGVNDTDPTVGTLKFIVTPPANAHVGNNFARLRWSSKQALTANELALNGEIEDYLITTQQANQAPTITSNGGGSTAAISLQEGLTAVTQVTTTDLDNNPITYSISGGTDSGLFTIDSTTGQLSFSNAPSYSNPQDSDTNNVYQVIVTANDGDGGIATQTITVTILPGTVALQIHAWLQGAYNSSLQLMSDTLRTKSLLPSTQPYSIFGYQGTETLAPALLTTTGNDAIVDWVLVEIRDATTPTTIIKRFAALIQRDGDVVDSTTGSNTFTFNASVIPAGNYHISLRHRNHLGVMTGAAVALNYSTPVAIDFGNTNTLSYGDNAQINTSTLTQLWGGDISLDNLAIAAGPNNDLSLILGNVLMAVNNTTMSTNYLEVGYKLSDLNMDGNTIFAGPNNDANLLLGNILMHPINANFASNYVIKGTLPKAP
jgi:hypothetical protein